MLTDNKVKIQFSRGLPFYFVILILVIPIRLLFAVIISVAVHELFHLIALRALGVTVFEIVFDVGGARIKTQEMLPKIELLCALAGPIGGLLLVSLYRYCPAISICALAHTCYNLLPVFPTDGGRVLRCAIRLLSKNNAQNWITGLELAIITIIIIVCVYVTIVYPVGVIPICFATMLLLNGISNK